MLITCLRHATAEPHTSCWADAERALVKKGLRQVSQVAAYCRQQALLPGTLYSSPLKRAQQTAQCLQAALPGCPPVQVVSWLGLQAEQATLLAELQNLQEVGAEDVWLVGHEPDFSELIACLLHSQAAHFCIKKASLTRLAVDFKQPEQNRLLWSVPCALMGA